MTQGMIRCYVPAPKPDWEEIPPAELVRHRARIAEAVDALCKSPAFRTSARSCEFLRHVVQLTLQGNAGELKERLIGMALLGRDAAYDTSTDAGVRVRANDVRKRLNHYNVEPGDAEIQIHLAAGSYVPVFWSRHREPLADARAYHPMSEAPPPLSFTRLAVPTFVALSLCILCIRWEVAQERTFSSFREEILRDNRAVLYLSLSPAAGDSTSQLRLAAPLLDLAGEFHHRLTPVDPSRQQPAESLVVTVGPELPPAMQQGLLADGARFRIVATPSGRRIFDSHSGGAAVPDQGVLLTVVAGNPRLLWIDGTNEPALQSVVERLCDQSSFPGDLAQSFRPGTATQAVFSLDAHATPILVRYSLAETQSKRQPLLHANTEFRH